MSELVRAFIAITIPDAIRIGVRELQDRLKNKIEREKLVRWTLPEQLHLTLRFLGNTPADQLGDLTRALQRAAAMHSPFELHLKGGGCFPSCANPRIIWTAVGGAVERLMALQSDVVKATASFGEPLETRAYKPHLTIGRVRADTLADQRLVGYTVRDYSFPESALWTASEAQLIRSDLSSKGSTYTLLASAPFRG